MHPRLGQYPGAGSDVSRPIWPKSADGVGCCDPPSQRGFDFCYLWKHWSHNADVKKFNDLFVRNAAISSKDRKTAVCDDENPRFPLRRAILRLKSRHTLFEQGLGER